MKNAVASACRNPKNVYRRFIEFEEKAAELYLMYASHFAKNRQFSALWFDMAMEEKQHAGLLQFCLCEGLFASPLPDSKAIQRLDSLFRMAITEAKNPKLSMEKALTMAIELESSEVDVIYNYLTTPLHKSMYLFRRKIQITLPRHVEKLINAARKFGIKNLPLDHPHLVKRV